MKNFIENLPIHVDIYHFLGYNFDLWRMILKNVKFASLLSFGLVMALFSACFSPVGVIPSDTRDTDVPGGQNGSFPADIYVNQGARSVAGASSTNIQNGLYNFVQLIVINDSTRSIAAFAESRKARSSEPGATLSIDGLPYGENYTFLLMFGNWERDVNADVVEGDEVILAYNEETRPVLLAAGYKKQRVTESGVITINMYPMDIDTVFKATGPQEAHPGIGEAVGLRADRDWWVEWTLGNGIKRLIEAGDEASLPAGNRKFFLDGSEAAAPLTGDLTTANSTVTGSLPNYNNVSLIGTTHWVNFYLEYVPFNLTTANWGDYDNISKFPLSSSPPVWVIRNGLNNSEQNNGTDFTKVGKPAVPDYKDYNGNGGVLFEVLAPYESGYYVSGKRGNDGNGHTGSFYDPFYTLGKALSKAATDPGKPVIIMGTLTDNQAGSSQTSTSAFTIYQSVTVKGYQDPSDPPILKGTSLKRVLETGDSAGDQVILENITLTEGRGQLEGAGVYVNKGTLTLGEGAKVTGNGDVNNNSTAKTKRGGGVYVNYGATLKMEGGEISNNRAGANYYLYGGGGGLFVYGTARLNRGVIANNYSRNDGGGVLVGGDDTYKNKSAYATVYMENGMEVYGNESGDDGGGIGVDYNGRFYMNGGIIHSNKSGWNGGGLRLEYGYVEIDFDATITGQDRTSDGNRHGTGKLGHAFSKYSGTNNNNTISGTHVIYDNIKN
jgi:hypothetical protein